MNKLYDTAAELRDRIKAEERAAEIRAEIDGKTDENRGQMSKDEMRDKTNKAFKNMFLNRMTSEDREIIAKFDTRSMDQNKTTAGDGGYTVPTGFQAELE